MNLPKWVKRDGRNKKPYFIDGDEFIVALKNGKGFIYHHIFVDCDGEGLVLRFKENLDNESCDFSWFEVVYYMPIKAEGPLTEAVYKRIYE